MSDKAREVERFLGRVSRLSDAPTHQIVRYPPHETCVRGEASKSTVPPPTPLAPLLGCVSRRRQLSDALPPFAEVV